MSRDRDRYLNRLKKVSPAIKARVNTSLQAGAEEYANMMRRLAPVADGVLQRSIVYYSKIESEGLVWRVQAGNEEAYYVRWVEFGTAGHSVSRGANVSRKVLKAVDLTGNYHPGAAAQPFFYPSIRALQRRVKSRIVRAWRAGIRETAT